MGKNFTAEQMLHTVRQAESGTPSSEVYKKIGITKTKVLQVKAAGSRHGNAELTRLRQLEDENKKLRALAADVTVDKHMLKRCSEKVLKPVRKRAMAN